MASSTVETRTSRSVDRGLAVAAWTIAGAGVVVAIVFYRGTFAPDVYSYVSISATVLALVGLCCNRPKPLTPWLLLVALAVFGAAGEAFREAFATGLATQRDFISLAPTFPPVRDLIPDLLEISGYVCLVLALERFVRARRGSDPGVIIDVALVLVGGGALAGQLLLAPITTQATPLFDKLLNGAYPVLDLAALFLALLLMFTIREHNPSSRFLFTMLTVLFVGDVVTALVATEETGLQQKMADSLYLVAFALMAATIIHPAMRKLTAPQPGDARVRVGPRRLVLVAVGLCVPAVYAILRPSDSLVDRIVLSAACVCLGVGVVFRGWQAIEGQMRADARFSALTRQSNDLFIVVDPPDFTIRYTATSATTSLADFAANMRDRPLTEFFGPDIVALLSDATSSGYGGPFEVQIQPRGRSDRHVEITWTTLGRDAFPGSVLLACRDVNERAQAREHIQQSEQHVRELNAALRATIGRLTTVEDDERRRVARDLHDTVVQDLVALRWEVAELASRSDPRDTRDLENLSERLASVTDTTRRVSHRLESPICDAPTLDAALRSEVVALRSPQLAIDLDARFDDAVPADVAALAFRTVREALRNVVHHAAATRVEVVVSARAALLEASVRDDGVGIAPHALEDKLRAGHIGVASMRDGIVAAGGTFEICSLPSGGAEVRLALPLCVDAVCVDR